MKANSILNQIAAHGIMPVIAIEKTEACLKRGTVAAVGGMWIARKEDLASGQWDAIRGRCQAARAIAVQARGAR